MKRWWSLAIAGALVACAGCSGPAAAGGSTASGRDALRVTASFYPLQFVAERIGGDRVRVDSLTRAGAEPHELELTSRDVVRLHQSDLVVYLGGFQPSVDQAVGGVERGRVLDVADAAQLTRPGDPHFWLDPVRLTAVADVVEQRLVQLSPRDAPAFRRGLAALQHDLGELDDAYRTGLAHCTHTALVTGHAAFGYLAQRYGLTQIGVSGLSPEAEPGARRLADVTEFVRAHRVRTVYTETLLSPAMARTVAGETGARLAVLDPVEAITDASAGRDYVAVMRADLAALRTGQDCR